MKYNLLNRTSDEFSDYPLLVNYVLTNLNINRQQLNELLDVSIKPFPETVFLNLFKILYEASKLKQKVMICGDYDCDGICSATIMRMLLNKLKIESGYYLPHRFNDGYGTSSKIISAAYKKGYRIVLMIDNGVSNFEAIALANELGMRVIIIDHHQISESLNVDCLIHPDLLYRHFYSMCASGLVYTLAYSLGMADDYMLVLAMIGTIGDVMPVLGQNRAIIVQGLSVMNKYHFTTIEQLTKQVVKRWSKDEIAFKIVPCFNCVSRLCDDIDVNSMVKYLMYDSKLDLYSYAKKIIELNQKRKEMSSNHYQLALNYVNDSSIFIAHNEEFHPGIIGIVAGKIASTFNVLAFVLAKRNDEWVGSCRSSGNIDIYNILLGTKEYLAHYGGHKSACGFSLSNNNLLKWKQLLVANTNILDIEEQGINALDVDPSCFSINSYNALVQLEPFGVGFELLPFCVLVNIEKIINFKNGGAKCLISPINDLVEIVVFNQSLAERIKIGHNYSVIGYLSLTYNHKNLSLIVDDII